MGGMFSAGETLQQNTELAAQRLDTLYCTVQVQGPTVFVFSTASQVRGQRRWGRL